jgi:hypothetical protein
VRQPPAAVLYGHLKHEEDETVTVIDWNAAKQDDMRVAIPAVSPMGCRTESIVVTHTSEHRYVL